MTRAEITRRIRATIEEHAPENALNVTPAVLREVELAGDRPRLDAFVLAELIADSLEANP